MLAPKSFYPAGCLVKGVFSLLSFDQSYPSLDVNVPVVLPGQLQWCEVSMLLADVQSQPTRKKYKEIEGTFGSEARCVHM